jgi:hypothetical protein
MSLGIRRAFVGAGLVTLAAPGLTAEHTHFWVVIGAGILAGLISAAVTR